MGERIMTRNVRGSLLVASLVIVAWATTAESCHRRRAYAAATGCYSGCYSGSYAGYTYASPTGQDVAGGGYATTGGGYYGGGYAGSAAGYAGGYDVGRPGYN